MLKFLSYQQKTKNFLLNLVLFFLHKILLVVVCFFHLYQILFYYLLKVANIYFVLFSNIFHLLPSNGIHSIGRTDVLDLVRHLILPALVLSVGNIATFTRYIRSNTITQLEEEYVLTAKAKGVTGKGILFGHVLKHCLLPVITLAGMHFASLVTGSFIVESVFGWPGMGTLGMSAINNRDYPLIMGFTMLSCLLLVVGNLVADVLYCLVDPRIRSGLEEVRSV